MLSIDTSQTGINIRNLMNIRDITVRDIQNKLGFGTPSCIYRWLNGSSMPTIDNLIVLADVLDCDINDILAIQRI